MNPEPIAKARLPDEGGDRVRKRLRPLGARAGAHGQQADDRETKKRSVRAPSYYS